MIRTALAATCLLAVMLLLVLSTTAQAQSRARTVCAGAATLRDTPRGFVIARLYRRQRVVVLRRSAARGWVPVRAPGGLPGWILARSLCRG